MYAISYVSYQKWSSSQVAKNLYVFKRVCAIFTIYVQTSRETAASLIQPLIITVIVLASVEIIY